MLLSCLVCLLALFSFFSFFSHFFSVICFLHVCILFIAIILLALYCSFHARLLFILALSFTFPLGGVLYAILFLFLICTLVCSNTYKDNNVFSIICFVFGVSTPSTLSCLFYYLTNTCLNRILPWPKRVLLSSRLIRNYVDEAD